MPRTTRSSSALLAAEGNTENASPSKTIKEPVESMEESTPTKKTKNSPKKTQAKKTNKAKGGSPAKDKKVKGATKAKGSPSRKRKAAAEKNGEESPEPTKKKKSPAKKKASDHQRITERDDIPKLWDSDMAKANGSYTFRVASWNVAGIRAMVKKEPTALADLCTKYDLDVLCLQETKLQEAHLDDPKMNFRGILKDEGYDDYWSCSTAKKGYSGTAVFVKQHGKKKPKQTNIGSFFAPKKKDKESSESDPSEELPISPETLQLSDVSYEIGKEIDNEGRTITLDFPFATITNVYVPNSGQDLKRLDYRTNEWDKDFLAFQQKKEKDRSLPVMWLGDLNIAHQALDVWNNGAKHLDKQSGVTPQERASFQEQLDAGYVDAFRKLHPTAKGHYSYWSMRAGNREPNKGLRLDYFICSPDLFSEESQAIVRDSYVIRDQMGSDHCPVVVDIEIKK